MVKAIAINLAVANLDRSRAFFEALGFSCNERFTNDDVAALVISDRIYAMLHTPASFRRFTSKDIVNSHSASEALLALEVESRAQVDEVIDRAIAAGARESRDGNDHGFMYERAFEDPDGHIWGVFWMDEAAVPQ